MKNISTIKSKVILSDKKIHNYTHRYLLERVWKKESPKATIIMLNPSYADELKWDYSSMRVMNFLIDQGYGGVSIVNLFSCIETNSKNLPPYNIRYNADTDKYIAEAVARNKDIIIAWGTNKNRKRRIQSLKTILQNQTEEKRIFRLMDSDGKIHHVSILKKDIYLKLLESFNDI
ncbi:DUF1643 domain-containing protein [Metallumcola ferriviriculae]|uniref:DUF1643 domain-containing protein n=1 Tax=Metallumcola ferriviriculae TaxID=3039180 RepID=A0AAU0UNN6_9FIRM|nr:DUF1643 domain-containing protein [Desulfitibacteraceae bacterium MK1]